MSLTPLGLTLGRPSQYPLPKGDEVAHPLPMAAEVAATLSMATVGQALSHGLWRTRDIRFTAVAGAAALILGGVSAFTEASEGNFGDFLLTGLSGFLGGLLSGQLIRWYGRILGRAVAQGLAMKLGDVVATSFLAHVGMTLGNAAVTLPKGVEAASQVLHEGLGTKQGNLMGTFEMGLFHYGKGLAAAVLGQRIPLGLTWLAGTYPALLVSESVRSLASSQALSGDLFQQALTRSYQLSAFDVGQGSFRRIAHRLPTGIETSPPLSPSPQSRRGGWGVSSLRLARRPGRSRRRPHRFHRHASLTARLAARQGEIVIEASDQVREYVRNFGRRMTVERMTAELKEGFVGIGCIKVELEGAMSFLTVSLFDRRGRFVVKIQPDLKSVEKPQRMWEATITGVEVRSDLRGGGIGTRLFANAVRFLHNTERVSRCLFDAGDLGPPVWARFRGLEIEARSIAKLQQKLRRLNRDFDLGLTEERIAQVESLKDAMALKLDGAPPPELIAMLGQFYERHGSHLPSSELARRAGEIGKVALLKTRFRAEITFAGRSATYPEFERSAASLVPAVIDVSPRDSYPRVRLAMRPNDRKPARPIRRAARRWRSMRLPRQEQWFLQTARHLSRHRELRTPEDRAILRRLLERCEEDSELAAQLTNKIIKTSVDGERVLWPIAEHLLEQGTRQGKCPPFLYKLAIGIVEESYREIGPLARGWESPRDALRTLPSLLRAQRRAIRAIYSDEEILPLESKDGSRIKEAIWRSAAAIRSYREAMGLSGTETQHLRLHALAEAAKYIGELSLMLNSDFIPNKRALRRLVYELNAPVYDNLLDWVRVRQSRLAIHLLIEACEHSPKARRGLFRLLDSGTRIPTPTKRTIDLIRQISQREGALEAMSDLAGAYLQRFPPLCPQFLARAAHDPWAMAVLVNLAAAPPTHFYRMIEARSRRAGRRTLEIDREVSPLLSEAFRARVGFLLMLLQIRGMWMRPSPGLDPDHSWHAEIRRIPRAASGSFYVIPDQVEQPIVRVAAGRQRNPFEALKLYVERKCEPLRDLREWLGRELRRASAEGVQQKMNDLLQLGHFLYAMGMFLEAHAGQSGGRPVRVSPGFATLLERLTQAANEVETSLNTIFRRRSDLFVIPKA